MPQLLLLFLVEVQVTVQTLPNIADICQSCTSLTEGGKGDTNRDSKLRTTYPRPE